MPSTLTPNQRIAKRYKVPVPGQFVRLPSVEVLCEWLKMNNLRVQGWRGELLVVAPDVPAAAPERAEEEQEVEVTA